MFDWYAVSENRFNIALVSWVWERRSPGRSPFSQLGSTSVLDNLVVEGAVGSRTEQKEKVRDAVGVIQ